MTELASESTATVRHKYGDDAAEVARSSLDVSGKRLCMSYCKVKAVTPVAIDVLYMQVVSNTAAIYTSLRRVRTKCVVVDGCCDPADWICRAELWPSLQSSARLWRCWMSTSVTCKGAVTMLTTMMSPQLLLSRQASMHCSQRHLERFS